ncbi:MAG: DNA repair protein RecN [Elusimicrobia bacterium]|nr:DNA repair protein RecN [Elusimicrobiota bacterium]
MPRILCYHKSMLTSLTIKNFGIIENISLSLAPGLNVLTGETGAGKSILIHALRFCLGDRFQASHLRDGADQCSVEASFDLSEPLIKTLPLEDIPPDGTTLTIQRLVTSDGKNRIRINGLSTTVGTLKAIGDRLIDIHGPHDHQLLLAEDMHLVILDALTDAGAIKEKYRTAYTGYTALKKELEDLETMARSRDRDLDLLSHQVRELEQVPLDEETLKALESEISRINNAEHLFEDLTLAMSALDSDGAGMGSLISRAYRPVQKLAETDPEAAPFLETLSSLQESASSLLSSLRDYSEKLSFDPETAKDANRRFDIYHGILKKYGPSLAEARTFLEESRKKRDLLSDIEHNTGSLKKKILNEERELKTIAEEWTKVRKKAAILLKKTIENELKDLGFKTISFETRIEKIPPGPEGQDRVVFFISPNVGESLKPLAEIVSSGESARIMLAIKKALMQVDPVPTLIFDEIDAQIGGRLGTVIGEKLREISRHRQVILITHLPQIAAFASRHIRIEKIAEKDRTKVRLSDLPEDARIEEMAHMLSGDAASAISRAHAMDMRAAALGPRKKPQK